MKRDWFWLIFSLLLILMNSALLFIMNKSDIFTIVLSIAGSIAMTLIFITSLDRIINERRFRDEKRKREALEYY